MNLSMERIGGVGSKVSLDIRCLAFGVLLLVWGMTLIRRAIFHKVLGFPVGDGRRVCFLPDMTGQGWIL